jgi:hypothetical protein
MTFIKNFALYFVCFCSILFILGFSAFGQIKTEILTGESLKRIVPTSFYFAGQSAETQMRNSAAARIGENRFVVVGLVDTSGYSTEIQGKYEGFFITDSLVNFGGKLLKTGAYGFGFAKDTVNIFDLSSKQIDEKVVRLYKGKFYVEILAK